MKIKSSNGFTLVETLVAITVLLIGVIGPLSIAARGIGDGLFARNQIAANYLAQEGVELVINKRFALALAALYGPALPPGATIFTNDGQISGCVNHLCVLNATDPASSFIVDDSSPCSTCQLVFNTNSGLYQQPGLPRSGDTGPVFKRRVRLTYASGDPNDVLKVEVVVDWKNKQVDKSLTIVEYVFGLD